MANENQNRKAQRRKLLQVGTFLAIAAGVAFGSRTLMPTDQGIPQIFDLLSHNNIEAIRQEVSRHPRALNELDLDGNTPLHIAALGGFDTTVKLLIDAGADVNKANNIGWTPLISSFQADRNQLTVAKALLAAGAKTDVRLADGRSLLDVAKRVPRLDPAVAKLLTANTAHASSAVARAG